VSDNSHHSIVHGSYRDTKDHEQMSFRKERRYLRENTKENIEDIRAWLLRAWLLNLCNKKKTNLGANNIC